MPRGYDALRDVLASANSPTQLKPHIRNLLNNDPGPPSSHLPPYKLTRDSLSPSTPLPPTPTDNSASASAPSPSSPHMPPPVAIPYNPINRRTPPTTVLIPLTPAELELFKLPRHALRLRAKRPDPALENPNFFPSSLYPSKPTSKRKREEEEEERHAKRSRDSGLVVEHCEFTSLTVSCYSPRVGV
jgi:mRNA (guanine-N7-)-methyltransferase